MIDGVAPRAKMNQQRERRYKKTFLSKYNKEEEEEENKENKKDWDSNKITPGTFFMEKIKDALYILKKDTVDLYDIYISDSNECGEGEHKIFHKLQAYDASQNVVINGLDADLIILSLLSHRPNITLMREAETSTYLNVDNLRTAILFEICKKWNIRIKFDTCAFIKLARF